ncbi:semaphorin-6B, partial [Tachysurus ichikawai]
MSSSWCFLIIENVLFSFHTEVTLLIQPSAATMPLFGLFWLVQLASSAFPEEPGALNIIPTE